MDWDDLYSKYGGKPESPHRKFPKILIAAIILLAAAIALYALFPNSSNNGAENSFETALSTCDPCFEGVDLTFVSYTPGDLTLRNGPREIVVQGIDVFPDLEIPVSFEELGDIIPPETEMKIEGIDTSGSVNLEILYNYVSSEEILTDSATINN